MIFGRSSFTAQIAALVIFTFGAALAARAQVTTGTTRGLITDATGAVVPNATVVVEEQNTGVKIETKTSADGQCAVLLLEPGVYFVSARASHFAPSRRTNVILATVSAEEETREPTPLFQRCHALRRPNQCVPG